VIGTWQIRIDMGNGNVLEPTMRVSKNGDQYKSVYRSTQGQTLDVKGLRVEDNTLKFTVTAEYDGNAIKVDYQGRPCGDKMDGSLNYDFAGYTGQTPFTARRRHIAQFHNGLPLVFIEEFENGDERWTQTDAKAWRIVDENGNRVYSQFQKSDYQPPVRSSMTSCSRLG